MQKLFIHIPKNGGMTIRKSPTLKKFIIPITSNLHITSSYTKNLHKVMEANGDHHGNEHARHRDVSVDARNKYTAFAVLRNPWARVASRYLFAKKVIEVEKKVPETYADVSSFEAFLEERNKWGGHRFFWHRAVRGWFNQREYVVDENCDVVVDCLRLEHLKTDLEKYFKIEFNDRRRNVTGLEEDWKKLYTNKTINIVGDWHKRDVDLFGFDFDKPATKNIWKPLL